ncbi:pilus assembly PilX family protein [Halomonas halmophila]|nr:hypothetical protein [Halomonas halmophila]
MKAPWRGAGQQRHQGMALPVVLILLAMGAMLGVAGLRAALTTERLAGNLELATQAQLNAEAALSRGLSALQAPAAMRVQPDTISLGSLTWQDFTDPARFGGEAAASGGCVAPQRCVYRYLEAPSQRRRIVAMGAFVTASGDLEAASRPVVAEVAFSRAAARLVRFVALADGRIIAPSDLTSQADVHANAAVAADARIGLPAIDTSPPDVAVALSVRTDAQGQAYCRFEASGDRNGRVYHCPGRLEVAATADFHHATLMARGDVTLAGQVGQGERLDVAILAGGDIRLSSTARAWLLAAGDIELEAGSRLAGALLAHGDMRIDGDLQHRVGHPRLPNSPVETRLVSWQ